MGGASGIVEMTIDTLVQPGQKPPSFLPLIKYRLRPLRHRCTWAAIIEPPGWGSSLLQVFHYNCESPAC
jgi:hypothetical protein